MLELARRHALRIEQDPQSKVIAIRMQNRETFDQVLSGVDADSSQEEENSAAETEEE